MTRTNDRALQPVPEPTKKVVSWEELAQQQPTTFEFEAEEDGPVTMPQVLTAYDREAARMRAAGARRRITAEDLP